MLTEIVLLPSGRQLFRLAGEGIRQQASKMRAPPLAEQAAPFACEITACTKVLPPWGSARQHDFSRRLGDTASRRSTAPSSYNLNTTALQLISQSPFPEWAAAAADYQAGSLGLQ